MIDPVICFIKLRPIDAIDILLVAYLLYQLYKLIKGTVAINIFIGMLSFYLLWVIVRALDMQLLSTILGQFIGVGVIALIIVFQQELRRFLLIIGTSGVFDKSKFGKSMFSFSFKKVHNVDIETIVRACASMAGTKTGAIMVLATRSDLNFFANTGEIIDARVTKHLLESIFFKNNPLHDGAVIIKGNQIKAARCVLPVTEDMNFPISLGMRHRAAVGITEASDAIAVVVSEQTGSIAFSKEGGLKTDLTPEKLQELLEREF